MWESSFEKVHCFGREEEGKRQYKTIILYALYIIFCAFELKSERKTRDEQAKARCTWMVQKNTHISAKVIDFTKFMLLSKISL